MMTFMYTLITPASNMHEKSKEKMKKEFSNIFTEERYRTSSVRQITSVRPVKYLDSATS